MGAGPCGSSHCSLSGDGRQENTNLTFWQVCEPECQSKHSERTPEYVVVVEELVC
jgi:hypothetical protein